jgi:hypothetical protein
MRRSLLVLLFLLAGIRWPVARFGTDLSPLGRIDLLSVHGMSHARVDGAGDPPQVALAGLVAGLALAGVFGWRPARKMLVVLAPALTVLTLARLFDRTPIPFSWDLGLLAALGLAATALVSDRAEMPPHGYHGGGGANAEAHPIPPGRPAVRLRGYRVGGHHLRTA